MRSLIALFLISAVGLAVSPAYAQPTFQTESGGARAPGVVIMCLNSERKAVVCSDDGLPVTQGSDPLPEGDNIIGSVHIVDSADNELSYAAPDDATVSSVNDTATATTCLASNANRQGARFYNDSTAVAYLLEDEGTASATNFTIRMDPGGFYVLPVNTSGVYTDAVGCIWASDASGAMRVTEITP